MLKGCTYCAMILCDRAIDSHLKPLHIGNTSAMLFSKEKMAEITFDQYPTCLVFPVRWVCFLLETSHIAQWVHLLYVSLLVLTGHWSIASQFSRIKLSHCGYTMFIRLFWMETWHSTREINIYFEHNYCPVAQCVPTLLNLCDIIYNAGYRHVSF